MEEQQNLGCDNYFDSWIRFQNALTFNPQTYKTTHKVVCEGYVYFILFCFLANCLSFCPPFGFANPTF
jgi:hypothetical protein